MPRLISAPNLVSISRVLLLVPLTMCLLLASQQGWAATSLILFGATDGIDGWLARRGGQVTRLGAALDVGADRVGIATIMVTLAVLGILPGWMPTVIVTADLALLLASLADRKWISTAQVTWLGKIRTALIMTALPILVTAADTRQYWTHDVAMVLLTLGCLGHLAAAAMPRPRP